MFKMTPKQKILFLLNKMPENSSYEDIIANIYFISKVENGFQQIEEGKYFTHEEVKRILMDSRFRGNDNNRVS